MRSEPGWVLPLHASPGFSAARCETCEKRAGFKVSGALVDIFWHVRTLRAQASNMLNRLDIAEGEFLRAIVDVAGDALMVIDSVGVTGAKSEIDRHSHSVASRPSQVTASRIPSVTTISPGPSRPNAGSTSQAREISRSATTVPIGEPATTVTTGSSRRAGTAAPSGPRPRSGPAPRSATGPRPQRRPRSRRPRSSAPGA